MSGERLSDADLDRIEAPLASRGYVEGDSVEIPAGVLHELVAEVRRLRDVIDMAQGKRPGWAVVRVPQDIADALHARIASLLTVEEVFARIHGERAAEAEQRWAEGEPAPLDTGRWERVADDEWQLSDQAGALFLTRFSDGWEVGSDSLARPHLRPADLEAAAAIIRNEENA